MININIKQNNLRLKHNNFGSTCKEREVIKATVNKYRNGKTAITIRATGL